MSEKDQKSTEYEEETVLKDLVHLVVEGLKDEYREDLLLEALYTKKLKSNFFSDMGKFENRFVKGYDVLMETLRTQES